MELKTRIVTYLFVGGTALLAASPTLMDFLGRWEGRGQYVVYADKLAGGLPTVCKGITRYTSPYPVVVGERWSPEKCAEVERKVVLDTQMALRGCITHPVPQGVFDALTSHAHNFGWPRTCGSDAVAAINRGDLKTGCDRLAYGPDGRPVWAYVGTRYVQGLHNRRKAERELCLSALD